jgi:hypothetical protein
MSKLSREQKIAIIGNMTPPVALTGKESVKELDLIIKQRNGVTPAETADESEAPEVPEKSKAETGVHFVLADGRKRSFTPEDHGDDFVAVADEFHTTNKKYIVSRTDE